MNTNEIINLALIKASKEYDKLNSYRMVDECSHQILAQNLATQLKAMGYEIIKVEEIE